MKSKGGIYVVFNTLFHIWSKSVPTARAFRTAFLFNWLPDQINK